MVIHLLAKAPLASDLRFVTVAMKISQNLERVGDEAAKIAKRARDLSGEPPVKINLDLPRMAALALAMLKAALDAFVNRDPVTARAVIPKDKEVNALNKQINSQLTQHMIENPQVCVAELLRGVQPRSECDRPRAAQAGARRDALDPTRQRDDADADLRQSEHRALGRPDEIAEQGELESAGHARAVHSGERREGKLLEPAPEIEERRDQRSRLRLQELGGHTAGKAPRVRAREHERPVDEHPAHVLRVAVG